MELQISKKQVQDIDRAPVLQQTSFWSKFKKKQGVRSKSFDIMIRADDFFPSSPESDDIKDDFLILFQEIGHGCKIGYVPYGPTLEPCEESQGLFLEELSESLRPYLDMNCILVRYDLSWESLWAKDDSRFGGDGWIGPPEKKNQEIRLNFNTRYWNLKKANTDMLPKDTVFINLANSKEKILGRMKAKTRYNIRLAQRKGVRVRKADLSDLDIWYTLYRETCSRNNIFLHDLSYFRTILCTRAKETRSPAEVELLIAECNETPLAAMFLVYSARRATYLYGASSSSDRNLMAPYLLQWEAIQRAKRRGCTEYDMFGVAPNRDPSHPMHGLYRFKTGFGGEPFHRMGCWDYPLERKKYEAFLLMEMQSQGYYLS
mgnify:CR=1 FL=1